jgi:hypothetical protein
MTDASNRFRYAMIVVWKRSSTVQRLSCRLMTARGIGLHIHRHVDSTIILYYNRKRDASCYKSYIGNIFRHYLYDILFIRGLLYDGIDGGCACFNRYHTHRVYRHLLPESHFWDPYRHPNMGFPGLKFTCRY